MIGGSLETCARSAGDCGFSSLSSAVACAAGAVGAGWFSLAAAFWSGVGAGVALGFRTNQAIAAASSPTAARTIVVRDGLLFLVISVQHSTNGLVAVQGLRCGCDEESQRDSVTKPRVARNELPWEWSQYGFNPERVVAQIFRA